MDPLRPAPRSPARNHEPAGAGPPLRQGRLGPLQLLLYPARHPTADIEIAAALVGLGALVALLFLPLGSLAELMPECRFHAWTGRPCATCGITRGIVELGGGHWRAALRCNPLLVSGAVAFLGYALLAAVLWAFRLPRPRIALASRGARLAAGLAALAAILANWAFLVVDGR